jgi:hypothetical protein
MKLMDGKIVIPLADWDNKWIMCVALSRILVISRECRDVCVFIINLRVDCSIVCMYRFNESCRL